MQIRLSSKHPKADVCDYHAKVDLYGLGPGVYPKADAPKPPFHTHCFCQTAPRIDLINPKPKFNPNAERTFLATLPAKEAAQVAGSFEKRRRILEDKETLESIYNEGKDELYQWRRMGDVEDRTDLALPSVKDLKKVITPETATPTSVRGNTLQEAVDLLRAAVGVIPGGQRTVATPLGDAVIDDQWLLHIVEKRHDARERYAHLIIPTLERPTEIWLSPYGDEWRRRYIKLFSGPKYDLLVVVKMLSDGGVVWNAIPMDVKSLDKQRQGKLLWKEYQSAGV